MNGGKAAKIRRRGRRSSSPSAAAIVAPRPAAACRAPRSRPGSSPRRLALVAKSIALVGPLHRSDRPGSQRRPPLRDVRRRRRAGVPVARRASRMRTIAGRSRRSVLPMTTTSLAAAAPSAPSRPAPSSPTCRARASRGGVARSHRRPCTTARNARPCPPRRPPRRHPGRAAGAAGLAGSRGARGAPAAAGGRLLPMFSDAAVENRCRRHRAGRRRAAVMPRRMHEDRTTLVEQAEGHDADGRKVKLVRRSRRARWEKHARARWSESRITIEQHRPRRAGAFGQRDDGAKREVERIVRLVGGSVLGARKRV